MTVQACFVEIDSGILEVRRLIPDLRLVSEKINHGCTSEIERVEASIVAIKRKVIETKVLAITRIHQPTKRQTDKNLSNQLSDVSGLLTSSSYVYTHSHNVNTSSGGQLTNTDGTGVQLQPSANVQISIKQCNASRGGQLSNSKSTGVQPQSSSVVLMSIKQDNASSGGQLSNSKSTGVQPQPSLMAQMSIKQYVSSESQLTNSENAEAHFQPSATAQVGF